MPARPRVLWLSVGFIPAGARLAATHKPNARGSGRGTELLSEPTPTETATVYARKSGRSVPKMKTDRPTCGLFRSKFGPTAFKRWTADDSSFCDVALTTKLSLRRDKPRRGRLTSYFNLQSSHSQVSDSRRPQLLKASWLSVGFIPAGARLAATHKPNARRSGRETGLFSEQTPTETATLHA